MENKKPILNFKRLNRKAIMLFGIVLFYIGLIAIWSQEKNSPLQYGGDYLAFWSAGRVADEFGFSQVYDLSKLAEVQKTVLENKSGGTNTLIAALPSPYFSIFLVPFKFLSRMQIQTSYWFWAVLNFLILGGYLIFFLKRVFPNYSFKMYGLIFLAVPLSFPVFDNFVNGQLNVFLLVCVGEFIRNAMKQRPYISGIWLGGMLLKPQILILILPVMLIQHNWKAIWGFAASSIVVVGISTLVSGIEGMISYARLLTGWGQGNSVTAPEAMVNWRMLGAYINTFFGSPFGWIFAGIGVLLTLASVYWLIRRRLEFGSPEWVLVMLGVMAATLVVTWHSHAHMAVVLIPLLIYAAAHKKLTENVLNFWAVFTPAAWFAFLVLGLALQKIFPDVLDLQGMVVAISGFVANLVVLIAVFRSLRKKTSSSFSS